MITSATIQNLNQRKQDSYTGQVMRLPRRETSAGVGRWQNYDLWRGGEKMCRFKRSHGEHTWITALKRAAGDTTVVLSSCSFCIYRNLRVLLMTIVHSCSTVPHISAMLFAIIHSLRLKTHYSCSPKDCPNSCTAPANWGECVHATKFHSKRPHGPNSNQFTYKFHKLQLATF